MEIRVAGVADASAVGKVHSEAWKSAYRGVFPDRYINSDTASKRTDEFLDSIKDDKYTYYLLQESNQTAGIVKTHAEENSLEIESFYILNEYRGKGLGSQFIDFIKNSVKPECIFLWCLEDNSKARHFYENNGFVMTGDSRMINRGIELKQIRYNLLRQIGICGGRMRIGVIQASSQATKNKMLYNAVTKYAPKDSEVINFGCTLEEKENYSYIEISILVGMLLANRTVDFIVTGCSSGQGMMLACNSMPGVICGYAPTPKDAYLFAQINNGNAISLPLGEEYTWSGIDNLERTVEALFSEPFGQGYPKSEADRKIKDSEQLKKIRKFGQISMQELLNKLDVSLVNKLKNKMDF